MTNCSPAASASTGEKRFQNVSNGLFFFSAQTIPEDIVEGADMTRFFQVPNPEAATMPTQLLPRPLHGRTGGLCQETGEL